MCPPVGEPLSPPPPSQPQPDYYHQCPREVPYNPGASVAVSALTPFTLADMSSIPTKRICSLYAATSHHAHPPAAYDTQGCPYVLH